MWNDCEVASWNGIQDVQETDKGQTKETQGLTTFSFPRTKERERTRDGFYVGAPSLRQFGAHTKRWPPVIQKFAGYGGTFTNDEGDFIPSVYLNGNPRDTVRERVVFCIYLRANLYPLILNADNVMRECKIEPRVIQLRQYD